MRPGQDAWLPGFGLNPSRSSRSRTSPRTTSSTRDSRAPGLKPHGSAMIKYAEPKACPCRWWVLRCGSSQALQPSAYDCEYSGYYRSGVTVGPLRNGAPCRSTVANDPLEGIQIRIVKRPKAAAVPGKVERFAPRHQDANVWPLSRCRRHTPERRSQGIATTRQGPSSASSRPMPPAKPTAARALRSAPKNRIS